MFLSPTAVPRILAHRGQLEAENTLAAFQRALAAGADIIETDIRCTSDGVAVVFHDETLQRIAAIPQRVADLTFAQLRAKVPAIPSLAEALAAFPKAKFNIDFKSDDVVKPALAVIRDLKAETRVLITTFTESRLKLMRKLATQLPCSLSAARVLASYLVTQIGLGFLVKSIAKGFSAAQIPVSFGAIRLDSKTFIKAIKSAGLELHYWVINEPREADRLIALGADGIVTDFPERMIAHLRKP